MLRGVAPERAEAGQGASSGVHRLDGHHIGAFTRGVSGGDCELCIGHRADAQPSVWRSDTERGRHQGDAGFDPSGPTPQN